MYVCAASIHEDQKRALDPLGSVLLWIPQGCTAMWVLELHSETLSQKGPMGWLK